MEACLKTVRGILALVCLTAVLAVTPLHAGQPADFCALIASGGPVPSETAQGPIALGLKRWNHLEKGDFQTFPDSTGLLEFMNHQTTRQILLLHSRMNELENVGVRSGEDHAALLVRLDYAKKIRSEINGLRSQAGPATYAQMIQISARYLLAVREIQGKNENDAFAFAAKRETPFFFTSFELRHLEEMTTNIPTEKELSIRAINDVGPYPVYFIWLSKAIVDPKQDGAVYDGNKEVTDGYLVADHDRQHKGAHLLALLMQAAGGNSPTKNELLDFKVTERKIKILTKTIREREEFYWAYRAFSEGESDPAVREAMDIEWFDAFHERPEFFLYDREGLESYHRKSSARLAVLEKRIEDPTDIGGSLKNKVTKDSLKQASSALLKFAEGYEAAQKYTKMKRGLRRWLWRLFLKISYGDKARVIDQIERGTKIVLPPGPAE